MSSTSHQGAPAPINSDSPPAPAPPLGGARSGPPGQEGRIPLALYYHARDNVPKVLATTWPALARSLAEHRRAPCTGATCAGKSCPHKYDPMRRDWAGGWSAITIDGTRGNDAVRGIHALVLDLDKGDVLGAIGRVRADGVACVAHSSHSHREDSPHARLVFAVSRTVTTDEFPGLRRAAIRRYAIEADEHAKALSNMYFTPSAPSDAPVFAEIMEGAPLDVEGLLASVPDEPAADPGSDEPYDFPEPPDISEDARGRAVWELAHAWPSTGRHAAHLALAGGLLRDGFDVEWVAQFAREVAEMAQPGNAEGTNGGRYKDAADTWASLQRGDKDVTGWRTLRAAVGEEPVQRARRALGLEVDPAEFGAMVAKWASAANANASAGKRTDGMTNFLAQFKSDTPATTENRAQFPADIHLEMVNGKPIRDSEANMRAALKYLDVRLSYDRFADRQYVQQGNGPVVELDDIQIKMLRNRVEQAFRPAFKPDKGEFCDLLDVVSYENSFHSVLDYLDALPHWDGVQRVERWLIDLAGAEDTAYTRAVSRLPLVAAVRRVRRPGAKFDEMLILETPEQGLNKSKALRALPPNPDLFTDDLVLGMSSKMMIENTAGKWIIEAAEMHAEGAPALVKAALSRQQDRARGAYARKAQTVYRAFVIIGTTNEERYLYDRRNRRFWPVRLNKEVDVDTLVAWRDQLWAEACAIEAADPSEGCIRLPRELWPDAEIEQAKRLKVHGHVFTERLQEKLGDRKGKIRKEDVRALLGFGEATKHPSQTENEKITACMLALGWESKDSLSFGGGSTANAFVRGDGKEREVAIRVKGIPGVGDGVVVDG